ncbi:MAG: hypothetical protein KJ718_01355 [Nanoarchaeota archaeon]|nr:hypothetical protein [Nanoarchaeota archaeon]MBU1051180.1 hypothetical protein [Nanoarchaeota archaeon]MBU1988695.1 hypothetical protein [Nanoarchaeota archaeon]
MEIEQKQAFEDLMKNWIPALSSYGTSASFTNDSEVRLIPNPNNSQDIPFRAFFSSGFSRRRELMERQRRTLEERKNKGLPPRWKNDGASCFLCDNVGQAQDVGDNLLLPFNAHPNHVLVPNRYPFTKSHILFCAKEHDKISRKVPEIISGEYLAAVIELAEKYGLGALRNHPRAGMSLPDHEHVQFYPHIISDSSGRRISPNGLEGCDLQPTEYGRDVCSVARTRLDTLAFKGGDSSIEKILGVLSRLEESNKIFTWYYEPSGKNQQHQGLFFLTPHKKEDADRTIGGGSPVYIVSARLGETINFVDHMKNLERHIFPRGMFPWEIYI